MQLHKTSPGSNDTRARVSSGEPNDGNGDDDGRVGRRGHASYTKQGRIQFISDKQLIKGLTDSVRLRRLSRKKWGELNSPVVT
eukprot:5082951-Pyramimonas_sp.AAC.1